MLYGIPEALVKRNPCLYLNVGKQLETLEGGGGGFPGNATLAALH